MKTQFIKSIKSIFTIIIVIMLFACEKNGELNNDGITGVYFGSLTTTNDSSKLSNSNSSIPATVDVLMNGDQIEVHCFAEGFDIAITLDYYPNGNDVGVCLTGDDFENVYGHALGHGGLMHENMHQNSTQWMHHLNDEHELEDEHFGYFDLQQQSFKCTFQLSNGDFYFQGTKNL